MNLLPETSYPLATSSVIAPQSDSSRCHDSLQGENALTWVLNPSPDALSTNKTTQEDLINQRILKRAAKKTEIQEKAESCKRAGDLFLESRNCKAACARYLEAIRLVGNVPEYYISLADAYRKLTWYEEAAHAATRALTIDPKNLEARYIRGVARLEQRLLQAAQTDFETVFEHDPTHLRALAAIAEVRVFILQAGLDEISSLKQGNVIMDFGFPHWDYEALEVASVSDSSDCQHVGNGVPCRFYNHDGCGKGIGCPYSHAPDEKSVRDDLGKNVCIYHILASCKFGASRCVYSHSKEALPKRGWWNSAEKVAKVKGVLEVAEKNAKEQRGLEADKWKTHLREVRDEARSRRVLEKQEEEEAKEERRDTQKLEQHPRSAGSDDKKAGNKTRKVPVDATKKEDAKKEVEQVVETDVVEQVKTREQNAGGLTTPIAPPNSTTPRAKAKRQGKKKVAELKAQEKKVEGSANGGLSTALTTHAANKRGQRHHRRKTPPANNYSSVLMTAEGSTEAGGRQADTWTNDLRLVERSGLKL